MSNPTLTVGTIILAQWHVGPAQRGSGWIPAEEITEPHEYVIVGGYRDAIEVRPVSGGASAYIHKGEYRLPEQA